MKPKSIQLVAVAMTALMGCAMAEGGAETISPRNSEAAPEKGCLSAVLMGTVWPGGWTEVRWYHHGRVFRAISNIDYSRLPQMLEWESPRARYQVTFFVTQIDADAATELRAKGEVNQDGLPASWPARALLPTVGAAPESIVGWDSAENETAESLASATAVLDAFHDYYASHSAELLEVWQRREAQRPAIEAAARAAEIANQRKPRGVRFLGAWRAPKLDNSTEGNR